jgi:predicted Zn-dependent protease
VAALPAAYAAEIADVADRLRTDPAGAGRYLADHDPLGGLGGAALAAVLARDGVTPLLALLDRLHAAAPDAATASEDAVNTLGYRLLGEGRSADALAVFQWNARTFVQSPNAEDSLAEAYAKAGDRPHAVEHYRSALLRDARYPNADVARAFVAGQGP